MRFYRATKWLVYIYNVRIQLNKRNDTSFEFLSRAQKALLVLFLFFFAGNMVERAIEFFQTTLIAEFWFNKHPDRAVATLGNPLNDKSLRLCLVALNKQHIHKG